MVFDQLIGRFAKEAPVATMVRALMANVLSAEELNAIFRDGAERQRESTLLFSTIVELLSLAVSKAKPSLHAAYQTRREELGVSAKALYDKVQGVELQVTRELVRRTAERMNQVLSALEPDRPSPLAGYEILVLDGSHLAATQHRLKVTRRVRGGPLPGQMLVVLDPRRQLVVDVIPSEDGHAQERSLLLELVDELRPGQLWIADRNFCTAMWLLEIALNEAFFIIRQHAGMRLELVGKPKFIEHGPTGEIWEQAAVLHGDAGESLELRRITIKLDKPTEDGDRELHLLTNLPPRVKALIVAEEYRTRWTIEAAFGELTLSLNGEVDTLAHPQAALLCYAIALVTYNLLSVVRGVLRVTHGPETRDTLSFYYLADEVAGTWRGLEIAVPTLEWDRRFASLPPTTLAIELQKMARHVELRKYRKHPRGLKKKPPPRRGTKPHVSTARLLKKRTS